MRHREPRNKREKAFLYLISGCCSPREQRFYLAACNWFPGSFYLVLISDGMKPSRSRSVTPLIHENTTALTDTTGSDKQKMTKRWHLFPPEDTANLYPTRIPYEESSVFSRVDVLRPELGRFPAFRRARPHVVTLQPGQVLYVPRHWWHYVQSVDPITVSVNSWIELEDDDVARVSEAVTKAVVCAIKSAQSDDDTDDWLNPTEEGVTSHNENIQYLNLAVGACAQRRSSLCHVRQRKARPVKRGATGSLRNDGDQVDRSTFSVPFGPSLIPVCQREDWPEPGSAAAEEPVKPRGTAEDRVLISGSAPGTDPPPAERSAGSAPGRDRRHAVTTDDLLDCLLHPDVMSRVTELLLERHAGSPRSTSPP
ncbi:HSPB1-associated protein 1 homolog isoform X2 [Betta splendens]|uniref:HSPB1-associated protein 1 homolog isoform X2 n=1 Tax=Betta splendens TaxID=158456 RepID=A0A9W2XGI9_BETSP|nr:HSPB1-associated protein 1 homolog isoform X2 [Betta splendens]